MRRFLSTPSARRATSLCELLHIGTEISIHALREEGDYFRWRHLYRIHDFYPRPPRGGRPKTISILHGRTIFLSTPSARRATGWLSVRSSITRISIHALREEGDVRNVRPIVDVNDFYPRPPRGGRLLRGTGPTTGKVFLSTPSARRATPASRAKILLPLNFYPRPPRGGRLVP